MPNAMAFECEDSTRTRSRADALPVKKVECFEEAALDVEVSEHEGSEDSDEKSWELSDFTFEMGSNLEHK